MRVEGSGFRDQGPGFRVQGSGFRLQRSPLRDHDVGIRVRGLVFRVQKSRPGSCGAVPVKIVEANVETVILIQFAHQLGRPRPSPDQKLTDPYRTPSMSTWG